MEVIVLSWFHTNIVIQSNFDTMPPFGTERKWHSSEGGIVTRICKNSLVM